MKLLKQLSGFILLLMVAVMTTVGCDDEKGYSNTFTINGTIYAVEYAAIYKRTESRLVELGNETSDVYLGFEIAEQSVEIPVGQWTEIDDTDFTAVDVDDIGDSYNYDSLDTHVGHLTIGGTDGGTITISAAFDFSVGNSDSVAASYKGSYEYIEK